MTIGTPDTDICTRLRERGLESWRGVCFDLIEHLVGLEIIMEDPDEHPVPSIRTAIFTATAMPTRVGNAELLVQYLSRLPLFEYRVAAQVSDKRWQPLEETFTSFSDRHWHRLRFWRDWVADPSPSEVARWLRERHG